jgi:glycosyltransferase involved in cell wall biosynthesis
MKILHIAETIRGGPATVLNEVIPAQEKEFGTQNICIVIPQEHRIDVPNLPPGCIRTFRRPSRIVGIPALIAKTIHVIWTFQPDIIHIHSTIAGLFIRLLPVRSLTGAKIVYCPHGWAFHQELARGFRALLEWIEWALSFRVDRIIAISGFEYQEARRIGISVNRLELIENGISSTQPAIDGARWEDPGLRVLFVGRLDRQKGVDILIESISRLRNLVSVHIVGDNVVSRKKPFVVPDNVRMFGWLAPCFVVAQLVACDVVVMPSRWEGFGQVAIEAMRSGKAVVAARVGGLESIVINGVTGVLVEKEDVSALAEAISSRSAAEWAQLGRKGRQRFLQYYTLDRMHKSLTNLYNSLRDAS